MARQSPHARTRTRSFARARRVLVGAVAIAIAVASSVGGSQAASSANVTVTLDVLSATTLSTAGCPAASRTFGTVLPGTTAISAACNVQFGSTNNSSRLTMFQADSAGDAMHRDANGSIDTSAGSAFDEDGAAPYDGKTSVEFPEGGAQAKHVVMQPDGKFLLIGNVINGGGATDLAVARVTANGVPDTSWGANCGATSASCVASATGRTVVTITPANGDSLWQGVLQPDGKLVAVGLRYVGGFDNDCIVVRFTTAGLLDGTFGGGDGVAQYSGNPGGGWDDCHGITQLRDGRFMTTGLVWDGGGVDTVVARLTADGLMDNSFDGDGVKRIDIGGTTDDNAWNIHEVDGDKFLLVGERVVAGNRNIYVSRYGMDGTIDGGYASGGRLDLEWAATGDDYIGQTWFAPDGAGYIAGRTNVSGDNDIVAYRITAGGAPDPTWGNGTGKLRHVQAGRDNPGYGLVPQGDKVLIIGADAGVSPDSNVQVARFTSTGLDPTFNSGSPLQVDFNSQWDYGLYSTAARDGRVFVAATVGKTGGGKDLMGGFLLGGGTTVPDYGTDDDGAGDGDGDGDNGVSNWASPATQGLFAACLETRAGTNLTVGWTLDGGGSCTAADGDPWNAIQDAQGAAAKVLGTTTVDAASLDATAGIRFGVKASTRQAPGNYIAPIALEVLAPDA